MKCCAICTLIFDVEPTNVGRGELNPDICILCEEHYMKTQVTPVTSNRYHLEFESDEEIQAAIADPYTLMPILRKLYVSDAPSPVKVRRGPAPKKNIAHKAKRLTRKRAGVVPCQYCDRQISTRQIGNHERKCRQNPANTAISMGDD
jgi:hypothetical protein